ncbi:MAG TPA: helix-turn-helix domain-containing protein [Methylomirabilota bacterium]|nr:helix-turn-helix domain-containing protein [Ktedonobacteraceae bacterium]HYT41771.1 helix-turn-helix domain-containing protein [Methylomirabilota bacterium]
MLDKPYYSPEEVAEYLDVTPETIRSLCRAGKIPGARQVGRQWRIPREYLISEPHISDEQDRDEQQKGQ